MLYFVLLVLRPWTSYLVDLMFNLGFVFILKMLRMLFSQIFLLCAKKIKKLRVTCKDENVEIYRRYIGVLVSFKCIGNIRATSPLFFFTKTLMLEETQLALHACKCSTSPRLKYILLMTWIVDVGFQELEFLKGKGKANNKGREPRGIWTPNLTLTITHLLMAKFPCCNSRHQQRNLDQRIVIIPHSSCKKRCPDGLSGHTLRWLS